MMNSIEQARILSIDRVTSRITLYMKNGLITTGTYLYDISDLIAGTTVLVAKLDDSYVILNKMANSPRVNNSYSMAQSLIADDPYGDGSVFVPGKTPRPIAPSIEVETFNPSDIGYFDFTGNGYIVSGTAIQRGFCYVKYPEADIHDMDGTEMPEVSMFFFIEVSVEGEEGIFGDETMKTAYWDATPNGFHVNLPEYPSLAAMVGYLMQSVPVATFEIKITFTKLPPGVPSPGGGPPFKNLGMVATGTFVLLFTGDGLYQTDVFSIMGGEGAYTFLGDWIKHDAEAVEQTWKIVKTKAYTQLYLDGVLKRTFIGDFTGSEMDNGEGGTYSVDYLYLYFSNQDAPIEAYISEIKEGTGIIESFSPTDPTVANSKVYENGIYNPGTYSLPIIELEESTRYVVKAYARNNEGTAFYGGTKETQTRTPFTWNIFNDNCTSLTNPPYEWYSYIYPEEGEYYGLLEISEGFHLKNGDGSGYVIIETLVAYYSGVSIQSKYTLEMKYYFDYLRGEITIDGERNASGNTVSVIMQVAGCLLHIAFTEAGIYLINQKNVLILIPNVVKHNETAIDQLFRFEIDLENHITKLYINGVYIGTYSFVVGTYTPQYYYNVLQIRAFSQTTPWNTECHLRFVRMGNGWLSEMS